MKTIYQITGTSLLLPKRQPNAADIILLAPLNKFLQASLNAETIIAGIAITTARLIEEKNPLLVFFCSSSVLAFKSFFFSSAFAFF